MQLMTTNLYSMAEQAHTHPYISSIYFPLRQCICLIAGVKHFKPIYITQQDIRKIRSEKTPDIGYSVSKQQ